MANMPITRLRKIVRKELELVAFPDDQLGLGMDFEEFIPDFRGRPKAIKKLRFSSEYRDARTLFITPDNSLRVLREQALKDGKVVITTNWGIRRCGFVLLDPHRLSERDYHASSYLQKQEELGNPLTVQQLSDLGEIDLFITGALCVSTSGLRIGKGHGFADLEWGIFYALQMVNQQTPVFVVVHDCQVVESDIPPSHNDTVADVVFTPTRKIMVQANYPKPYHGIDWAELGQDRLDEIPFLDQLRKWLEERSR